jgi:hypothetical protein
MLRPGLTIDVMDKALTDLIIDLGFESAMAILLQKVMLLHLINFDLKLVSALAQILEVLKASFRT